MRIGPILKIIGLLLMLLSITFIPPLMIEGWFNDGYTLPFIIPFVFSLGLGTVFWLVCRSFTTPLRVHEGFIIVPLFWITACLVSAVPFTLMISPTVPFCDALFEAVSGLTTTGASIFAHVDYLPHSILYYRQQLQFIGGISIILFAVAILPALGIGGMQLFRTETTGPVKDDKITPRVTQTAKAIWLIYVLITLVAAICFYFAGMSIFDAICHSFSTVSTGGFSTHDASIGFYPSNSIKIICTIFMFLGAVNFNLHFYAFRRKEPQVYRKDPEFRFFLLVLFSSAVLIWIAFVFLTAKKSPDLLVTAFFEATSFMTTTGLVSTSMPMPSFVPTLLMFLGLIGGCAGSTSGGIKCVRALLLQKLGSREITRLIHPHGQYLIKLGDKPISNRIIEAIYGFFAVYAVIFMFLLLLLLSVEHNFYTAFSSLTATLSNTGRGFGEVESNFSSMSHHAKWILSFAMLAGRLEIFTLLVLFSPAFWRR